MRRARLGRHDRRVRSLGFAHHVPNARDHVVARGKHDHLGQHLGIRGRLQHGRRRQGLAQRVSVGQVPVMGQRHVAKSRPFEQRLRVDDDRRTRRRVTRVPHGDVAGQRAEDILVEDARKQAHVAMTDDRSAVGDGDACRLLSAMLKRVEPEIREPGHVVPGSVDADDAARFVQRITRREWSLRIVAPSHAALFAPRPFSHPGRVRRRCAAGRGRC